MEPINRWQSLAAQAIALSVDAPQPAVIKKQLLGFAALDTGNWSAAQAFAVTAFDPLSENDGRRAVEMLTDLYDHREQNYTKPKSGPRPVQLRTLFNRMAVGANIGLHLELGRTPGLLDVGHPRPLSPLSNAFLAQATVDRRKMDELLEDAGEKQDPDEGLRAFLDGMREAVEYAGLALDGLRGLAVSVGSLRPTTGLGHVEQICAAAVTGEWQLLLDSLRFLLSVAPERRDWARQDPFLAGVRHSYRYGTEPQGCKDFGETFATLVFDPVPKHFVEFDVFSAAETTALKAAGILAPADVWRQPMNGPRSLVSTLRCSAVRAEYLRGVAELGHSIDPADTTAGHGWLLQLVSAGIVTIDGLRVILRTTAVVKFQAMLETNAGNRQGTVPAVALLRSWRNL